MNLKDQCAHERWDEHTHHVDHKIRDHDTQEYRWCLPDDCGSSFAWADCPGGVAVTLNYEAATAMLATLRQNRVIMVDATHSARRIVDAALGIDDG